MSVYKSKSSAYFYSNFVVKGVRFSRSTGETSKAKAREVEKAQKVAAKAEIAQQLAGEVAPMTIAVAAGRYWDEVGTHHVNADQTLTDLNRLVEYFGHGKRLDEIKDADVAQLVVWRRAQPVRGRKGGRLISATTLNRSTLEPLQKLFNRAIQTWAERLTKPPVWKNHLLDEPEERVREVRKSEESMMDAIRVDYRPMVRFARESGLRMDSCLMKKTAVDLDAGIIHLIGKGQKVIRKPITTAMRAILVIAMTNPTERVFTYRAARAKKGHHARGDHLPITKSGLKTLWRRARTKKKGPRLPVDLRFHDMRHDFATRLLRKTGNLKLVQKALDHAKVETTVRYAHVLENEVLDGMEASSAALKAAQETSK